VKILSSRYRLCYRFQTAGLDGPRRDMTRRVFALLLLAAFGLGFALGPHPCRAWHQPPKSAPASCHKEEPSQARTDAQEESGNCCKTFCQHSCHMPAIAAAATAAFAFSPGFQEALEPAGSRLPLFAHPIDHVPLG
jgi:hypothetical protein